MYHGDRCICYLCSAPRGALWAKLDAPEPAHEREARMAALGFVKPPEPAAFCSELELGPGEEASDLRSYLDGLPEGLRDGAYGRAYRARLAELEPAEPSHAREARLAALGFELPDHSAVTVGDLIGLRRQEELPPPVAVAAREGEPPALGKSVRFLEALRAEGHIESDVADRATETLQSLHREIPALPAPRIGPGPDGMVGLTWEDGARHVNVEIFPDGRVELFAEDLSSGELWDAEVGPSGKLGPALLKTLSQRLPPVAVAAREGEPPNVLRTVAWIALAALVAFALGLLSGCAQAHSALEDRVLTATLDAWLRDLPEPREGCRIERFRIEHPKTLESFQRTCSGPGADPAMLRAWACLRWRLEAPRARSLVYPAAVLSPELPEARWPSAAVHELAHALCACALGDSDASHADPRVWKGSNRAPNTDSVEYRAIYGR